MTTETKRIVPALRLGCAAIALALVAACDDIDTIDIGPTSTTAQVPVTQAATAEPDSIVGKWQMLPAVGTGTRGCSIEFFSSSLSSTKGRVSPFACHQVEGLGGLHGVADINGWERKGRTIVLSGIAQPNIGTIELPRDSYSDRVSGVTREEGIRFVMVRQ
ncbi:hypothetical protein [Marinibacterium profundimaris]|uniref:Alkaline proteinase inhibitor/ Outer membrane lipoprotein Omp19 domain-containing protein n=1 Tax=Marinibacterium profundimaris TaxID=1679460 RepID=A0A225NNK9_9RHOB|nr:hypothetical protein [Marinibacterium profundimaris]OWU75952.1 hypothetical protein ATO3_07190 [Marinibacterium profundimaris]